MYGAAPGWRCCCWEASRRGFGCGMLRSSLGWWLRCWAESCRDPSWFLEVIYGNPGNAAGFATDCRCKEGRSPALPSPRPPTWDLGYFSSCWPHGVALPLGSLARKPWLSPHPPRAPWVHPKDLDGAALVTPAEGGSTQPFASPVAISPKVPPCRLSPLGVAVATSLGCFPRWEPPRAKAPPRRRPLGAWHSRDGR